MPELAPSRRRGSLALLLLVAVLLGYFAWSRWHAPADVPLPTAAVTDAAVPAPARAPVPAGLPAGAHYDEGGILIDAEGRRILNEAGLPPGPPLDPAKPIPVKAAPGEIVGYAKDANGVSKPLRAEDLRGRAANSPGTFAVVDMWADGGPVVVQATEGHHLTPSELAAARAAEDQRDRAPQQH